MTELNFLGELLRVLRVGIMRKRRREEIKIKGKKRVFGVLSGKV